MWKGVCGGVAAHLGVDSGLVRLATVLGAIFAGGVVIPTYIVLCFVLPAVRGQGAPARFGMELPRIDARVFGWAMVGLGGVLLVPALGLSPALLVAAALIALGVNLAFRRRG